MKRLHDEIRAKLIVELIKIISPETTIGDLELTLTNIERILIEEKILK